MKSRISLNLRIFMIILVAVFLTSITILSISFFLFSGVMKERFISKIHFIGNNISNISSIYFLTDNYEQLKTMSLTLLRDPDIGGVKITDHIGNILVSEGAVTGGEYEVFDIISSQSKFLTLFNPEQSQQILGHIYIYYSQKEVARVTYNLFFYSLFLGGLISILMIFVAYKLLSSNFLDPLRELIKNIQNIGKGEMSVHLYSSNLPEMQNLMQSFTGMVDSLKKSQQELDITYRKLVKEKSMAELGKFSLVIAHEFKNPLGIIKSALDILKKPEVDTDTKEKMLKYVHEEVFRLDNLIKEFLILKRPQEPVYKTVDMDDFLENIKNKIQLNYPDATVFFQCEGDKNVDTDTGILQKVLFNLTKNAVEAEARNILIKFIKTESSWSVSVIDDGKGINEEEIQKIFEPFYTSKKGGTGLGLVIVDQMVKNLNGEIKFFKNEPKGTGFELLFKI